MHYLLTPWQRSGEVNGNSLCMVHYKHALTVCCFLFCKLYLQKPTPI